MLTRQRKIIVTGGAGFIGSHLVDNLIDEGHLVMCLDNFHNFYDPVIKLANIARHRNNPRFFLVRLDINEYEKLLHTIIGWHPDIVIHLAARAGVRESLKDPFAYIDVNINGTLHVLNAAILSGAKKFIFGSSSSVYGINQKVPFCENDSLLTPVSPYAASKIAGEALCHSYSHLHEMPTVALRFFTVYGPRQRPDLAIHKFARLMKEQKPIPLYGDGTSRRDYTYVGDIITGIRGAIEYYSNQYYDVFNLGNSQTIELMELIGLLEEKLGQKAIIDRKPPEPGDVPQTWAHIEKARNRLGFEPKTPIGEGLSFFIEWLNGKPALT